jgi:Cu+-exporting ATPase
VESSQTQGVSLVEPASFRAVEGKGVHAKIGKESVWIGSRKLLRENGFSWVPSIEQQIVELENQGKTTVLLGANKKVAGLIAIADPIKPTAKNAVVSLQKMGKKVWVITGDNERTARAIAQQLGIEFVLSEVLPHEKSQKIKELQSMGAKVIMVGDGINDAPALAQAEVGIALGSGTDVAIETGTIVLMRSDPVDVARAIDLSRYTLRKIKENLFWAFAYNVVLIPVAMGALFPFFGLLLNPMFAGGAMAFSSVSVTFNSLRMKYYKPRTV